MEPTINRWFADVHLISPVTGALKMATTHRKLLESFVSSPEVHVEAARDASLAGGTFVDLPLTRVADAKALLDRFGTDLSSVLELANAVRALDAMLASKATGHSMQDLYAEVPRCLRGYVELQYDSSHRPRVCYMEPSLYASQHYRRDLQAISLWPATRDARAFVHSTPRLGDECTTYIPLAFDDARIDALARLRTNPKPIREVVELLGVDEGSSSNRLAPLVMTDAGTVQQRHRGPNARVRYLGHAGLLVETPECNLLVDPVVGYSHGCPPERFSFEDLPSFIDVVLITHGHPDHVNLETLLQLRHKLGRVVVPQSGVGCILDPSLRLALRAVGFSNVLAVSPLDQVDVGPNVVVRALPFLGEHGDMEIQSKASYAITVNDKTIMVGADAATPEPKVYEVIKDVVGEIDSVFLSMEPHGAPLNWGYAPLFAKRASVEMSQSRRQRAANVDELIATLSSLKPKRFCNYAMGREPWLFHILGISDVAAEERLASYGTLVRFCEQSHIALERPYGRMEWTM
jgi:L-ascorbate metabolism protein UlaG (beta-lactamase superfamily)